MTGEEFVAHLSQTCREPRDVIEDVLQALADTAENELRAGRALTVPGLCSVRVGVRLKGETGQPGQIVLHWQSDRKMVTRLQAWVNVPEETGNQEPVVSGQGSVVRGRRR